MGYNSTYHEDSDADDEYERSVITSPTLPPDFESSPTDSDAPSTEHTPTTFTHSADSNRSPTGLILQWTADQCADFISGFGLEQYADTFIDEGVTGDALVALQHAELKEMGVGSVGHRLTILKGVYEIKVKQNVPIDPDHYVPLSAEMGAQDTGPTQDDIARIIRIIKDRDERIITAETELRMLKEDLNKISEDNRKLREDLLPVVRAAKDRNQPLPTPEDHLGSPPSAQDKGSSLSRKFSTKKLFLGSAPKNPSPTIHEGRTLTDTSSLDPSAAAMAASTHLTASMNGTSASQPGTSPHPQPSPTSPAYSAHPTSASTSRPYQRGGPGNYGYNDDYGYLNDRSADGRSVTPAPLQSRTPRTVNTKEADLDNPPLSGGSNAGGGQTPASAGPGSGGLASSAASIAPSTVSTSTNPQVEIFKSFRVSIDDPCHKVLPVALKKYNIQSDWRQYALYIVHGDQERCLGLDEKPLILFKQLDKEGRKPMFMLRKHASPAEGHVSTVGQGGGPTPVGFDGGSSGRGGGGGGGGAWGGRVELPGGVL